MSSLAADVATLVHNHHYLAARELVKRAAAEGRVYLDAADKHNDGIARVLIDGFDVGQASSLLLFDFTLDSATKSGRVIPRQAARERETSHGEAGHGA